MCTVTAAAASTVITFMTIFTTDSGQKTSLLHGCFCNGEPPRLQELRHQVWHKA